jgi:hypothetical protein
MTITAPAARLDASSRLKMPLWSTLLRSVVKEVVLTTTPFSFFSI